VYKKKYEDDDDDDDHEHGGASWNRGMKKIRAAKVTEQAAVHDDVLLTEQYGHYGSTIAQQEDEKTKLAAMIKQLENQEEQMRAALPKMKPKSDRFRTVEKEDRALSTKARRESNQAGSETSKATGPKRASKQPARLSANPLLAPASLSSKRSSEAAQDEVKSLSLKDKMRMARRTKTGVDILSSIPPEKNKPTVSPSDSPISLRERLAAAKRDAAAKREAAAAKEQTTALDLSGKEDGIRSAKSSSSSLRDKLKHSGGGDGREEGHVATTESSQKKRSSGGRRTPPPAPKNSSPSVKRSSSGERRSGERRMPPNAGMVQPQVPFHPLMTSSSTSSPGRSLASSKRDGDQGSTEISLKEKLERVRRKTQTVSALSERSREEGQTKSERNSSGRKSPGKKKEDTRFENL